MSPPTALPLTPVSLARAVHAASPAPQLYLLVDAAMVSDAAALLDPEIVDGKPNPLRDAAEIKVVSEDTPA